MLAVATLGCHFGRPLFWSLSLSKSFTLFNVAFSSSSSSLCVLSPLSCLVPSHANNRNSSASSSGANRPFTPNVNSDTKLTHQSELEPNVKQNLDGEMEEDEDARWPTHNRRPHDGSSPGRTQVHYLPSVDRQTDGLRKFYTSQQSGRLPPLVRSSVSASAPTPSPFHCCHFLLLAIACAFSTLIYTAALL